MLQLIYIPGLMLPTPNVGQVSQPTVKLFLPKDNSGVQPDPVEHTSEQYLVEIHGDAQRRVSVIKVLAGPGTSAMRTSLDFYLAFP